MNVYETIKSMTLEEMAVHHALFAVKTIQAYCKAKDIEDKSTEHLVEPFIEAQMELLTEENGGK